MKLIMIIKIPNHNKIAFQLVKNYVKPTWPEGPIPQQAHLDFDVPNLDIAEEKLLQIGGLKIYGTSKNKTAVISFNIGTIHPYDIGAIIDKLGIAVRTGHHCAQPIMDFYKIPGTVRASFAFYNTFEEVDALYNALVKAKMMLS